MSGRFYRSRAGAQSSRVTASWVLHGIFLLVAFGCVGRQASSATTPSAPPSVQSELQSAEGAERSAALAAAKGTFTASRTCPLFQSKRDKTNPGNLETTIGASYAIRESLNGKDGAWYRVQTDAATSPLRWVSADCGAKDGGAQGNVCHLPSHQDSNLLALSWQPAFCASHKDKTECQKATPDRYDATHFTLHGLWPNQRACGQQYDYCGTVHTERKDFCSYPEVTLTPDTRQRLGQVMPSVAYDTCLERHEWWKHGTCWAGEPEAYFTEAMRLVQFINESSLVTEVLRSVIGKSIDAATLQQSIETAFGDGAAKKIELSCNDSHGLAEIRVSLPANIPPDEPLSSLLQRAPDAKPSCKGQMQIVAYSN
jgi:ribonuclease T2